MPFERSRAVFFDIDNTLYDFRASVRLTLAHLRERFPEDLARWSLDEIEAGYWAANASMSEETKLALIDRDPHLYRRANWDVFFERAARDLGPRDAFPLALDAQYFVDRASLGEPGDGSDRESRLAAAFGEWRMKNLALAAYEGALETVRDAKRDGRAIGVITNGPSALQRAKFRALGLEGLVPEANVLVSGEFGKPKPAREIFLAAAARAGVDPADSVFIGDSVECDVASKAVGMSFIFFDATRGPRPDFAACGFEPDAVAHDYFEVRRLLRLTSPS